MTIDKIPGRRPIRAMHAASVDRSDDALDVAATSPIVAAPAPLPRGEIPYMPSLDGLRAVALIAVLAFHGGFTFLRGGYLPLTAFFVLSGFLITALLLAERKRTAGTALMSFWARRAKRLVPAAIIGIGLAAVYVQLAGDRVSANARGDGLASLFWAANWRLIATGQSYADTFADPSPFQHYWSLSVEEQFYFVLPLLFAGLFAVSKSRVLFRRVTIGLTLASTIWMAILHQPGEAPLRSYFGTDTRGAELLVGVALATYLVDRRGRLRTFHGRRAVALDAAGLAALATSIALWFLVREFDDRLYEGGLLVIALLAAVVVTAATQSGSLVARLLSAGPLPWIGRLSYGVYIFHWPIFLYINETRTGLDTAPLFVIRMAVTTTIAWLSLRFIEDPIRRGTGIAVASRRGWAMASPRGWAAGTVATMVLIAVAINPSAPAITLDTGAQEGELPDAAPIVDASADDEVASPQAEPPPPSVVTPGPAGGRLATPDSPGSPDSGPAAAPAPTGASSSDGGTTVGAEDVASGDRPVRVMVIGDSVAKNFATGLRQWQEAGANITVYDATINGCPLSRGGIRVLDNGFWKVDDVCGWWATDELDTRQADFKPDVILVHAGINEIYDRQLPDSWAGAKGPGDSAFDGYMRGEWSAALKEISASGAKVLWSNLPCVDASMKPGAISKSEADRRISYFNSRILPAVSGAQILDFNRHVCSQGFTNTVEGVVDARPDGFHLTDVAALTLTETWLGPAIMTAAGR